MEAQKTCFYGPALPVECKTEDSKAISRMDIGFKTETISWFYQRRPRRSTGFPKKQFRLILLEPVLWALLCLVEAMFGCVV